jgi:hypothetical protein
MLVTLVQVSAFPTGFGPRKAVGLALSFGHYARPSLGVNAA